MGRTTKQQSLHHHQSSSLLRTSKFGSLNKSYLKDSKAKQTPTMGDNSSPLYRLGVALMNLNEKDSKAHKLM